MRTIGLPTQFASIFFESTGQKLAATTAGSTEDEIQVLDVTTGEALAHFVAPGKLWNLAWHPDGRRLALSLQTTNAIAIWDTAEPGALQWIVGPEGSGVQMDFSPDDKLLAAGAWDGRIRLWEVLTWELLLSIAGGWFVRFSPDGRRLGSGADGIAGRYDVAPARELTRFRDESQRPPGPDIITFNSTGTLLAYTRFGIPPLESALDSPTVGRHKPRLGDAPSPAGRRGPRESPAPHHPPDERASRTVKGRRTVAVQSTWAGNLIAHKTP